MNGTVDFFHDMKKYGFISPEGDEEEDIFFHISELDSDEVEEGDEVEFETEESDKGPKAVNITRL